LSIFLLPIYHYLFTTISEHRTQVIDSLSFGDGLLQRRDTISSASLPIARVWMDGHLDTSHTKHNEASQFVQAVQDLRAMCPAYQLKRMFFDILRDRVAQLYSQGQKRSTQRKSLQQFTERYTNSIVGGAVAKEDKVAHSSSQNVREAEWLRMGKSNPRILTLIKELPAVHTPRLILMLSQRRSDWVNSLIALNPKDILVLQEHLPAHLAAAQENESCVEMLKHIIQLHPNSLQTRDCQGRTPLHVACANDKGAFTEQLVAMILEHAPETALMQDHRGMLAMHHACLSSGPAAGSINGRLISIFAPGSQVVDDYGRLPLECALSSSSEGVGEIIKSTVRAFPPAARLLDKRGNNVLHRASMAIQDNPQAPEIIQSLLELKIRPNVGALFNYNRQLPLHIAASSSSEQAARCLELIADAYIPGAWAQESNGETPLHLAIRARNLESVRMLTIKSRDKAQHMQNSENKFPLNLATTRTYREVICQGGGQNKSGDMFTRRLIDGIGYVWCTASVVGVVSSYNEGRLWFVYIEASFLGLWVLVTWLSTKFLGTVVEESGWIGHLIMCIVPTLKSLESFLNIVPLAILVAYRALYIDNGILLSNQIVLVSAVVLASANAISEDGSRFHALELMPSASYTEIVVLFLYRVSELVSRIAVLALALIDIMHCHLPEEPSQPCPFRGCLLGNPSCEACSCKYKESVIEAIIAEFLFLLIFLRVTATQDNAQDMNAIEKLQNQVKIWACCLCNMQGIYMTPTKTMITYLGLKQAETAYIGEVKLLDGFVLLCIRAISNAGLLIIFTQVGERHDLWSETGSTALLYAGMASGPVQIIIAYVRYIIWDKIEQRVEMRFKLMSKREQILSSRGKEAGTDQTKTLSNSLDMLGKIMQPYHKREQRRKALMESSRDEPSNTKKHQRDGEPMFWNVKRQSARLPGDRHVLPLAVPEFVIFPSSNSGLEGNAVRDGEGGDIHDAGVLPIKASTQTGSEDAALEVESPVHLNDGPGGQAHQSAIPKRLNLDLLEQGVKWITQFDLNFESDAGNKVSNVWIF
jgi:ankyrin repeat protein